MILQFKAAMSSANDWTITDATQAPVKGEIVERGEFKWTVGKRRWIYEPSGHYTKVTVVIQLRPVH